MLLKTSTYRRTTNEVNDLVNILQPKGCKILPSETKISGCITNFEKNQKQPNKLLYKIQTFGDVISKHIVTLLGESQLVDCVMNEASFQQVTSIAPGITPVNEALDVAVQPINHL